MLYFEVFCIVLFVSLSTSIMIEVEMDLTFKAFKQEFNKTYPNSWEERIRHMIFSQNWHIIQEHNKDYEKGLESYSLGINEYSDMAPEEFQNYMNGQDPQDFKTFHQRRVFIFKAPQRKELPTYVDWREFGAVTPVKRQSKCGSCWAFAATGALEGQHFLNTGKLVILSEQNLIDCTIDMGNFGCDGGSKERSFLYVRDNGVINTESTYPYVAHQNSMCYFNSTDIGATCEGFVTIAAGDEKSLTAAVAKYGPVAVAMNGHCLKWQFYKSGIFNDSSCNKNRLTHALLIVGYGRNATTQEPYWIIKNSWGPKWGMDGYLMVPRFENFAGIGMRASIPMA